LFLLVVKPMPPRLRQRQAGSPFWRLPPLGLLLLIILLSAGSSASAGLGKRQPAPCGPPALNGLVTCGGYGVGSDRSPRLGHNLDRSFTPASILKIVTALAALEILGPDFRFATRFTVNTQGDLFIQGFGDPLLDSEEVLVIVKSLQALGLSQVHDLILDDSAFRLSAMGAGNDGTLNPYDAANGALAVNFNTINVQVMADGRVISAEPQTPTLPLMAEAGRHLAPGMQRINISQAKDRVPRYTGQLFQALLAKNGIQVQGAIRTGTTPAGLAPLLVHRAREPLVEMVRAMLRYSSNYIANQLFLTVGASRYDYPADWPKARRAVQNFYKTRLPKVAPFLHLEEGSGLSRKNTVTPAAMLAVLEAFRPFADLLPEKNTQRIKTGTMEGVYSLAGYLTSENGLESFVIILNQRKNSREAVLERLKRGL